MDHGKPTPTPGSVAATTPLLLVYLAVLITLAVPAIAELNYSAFSWPVDIKIQSALLIVLPAVVLVTSVNSPRHSLAWSIYWTWSLIFLGLAGSYQMAGNSFPWKGFFAEEYIRGAQYIILLAHCCLVSTILTKRKSAEITETQLPLVKQSPGLKKAVLFVMTAHILVAAAFCSLMGPSLFSGRLAFQTRLAGMEDIPGFGSMYFISNAGAIIIPAMAIILRKAGLDIPQFVIIFSVVISFLATNPFIGSRFLTGSFLVAVVAASVSSNARRWIPVGMIVAFVTVFPTLDLLRGDGTGASTIALTSPEETLTTFDYDSFEMLVREVSVQGNLPGGLPSVLELFIAPFFRWIPGLSQAVQGHASGPVVATSSGMTFTNVSMPLWGEAHLIGSWSAVIGAFLILGLLLAKTRQGAATGRGIFGTLIDAPMAALLFIILRGSLYEVLGYLLLAAALGIIFSKIESQGSLGSSHPKTLPSGPNLMKLSARYWGK